MLFNACSKRKIPLHDVRRCPFRTTLNTVLLLQKHILCVFFLANICYTHKVISLMFLQRTCVWRPASPTAHIPYKQMKLYWHRVAHNSLGSRILYVAPSVKLLSCRSVCSGSNSDVCAICRMDRVYDSASVCSCWCVVCYYRKLGSGSVRSGLSLPHLLGAFVVLALGLLLAVVSLLIELGYRHVTAAPTVSAVCVLSIAGHSHEP